jgi:DNA-binding transcriptional MocR family regulator
MKLTKGAKLRGALVIAIQPSVPLKWRVLAVLVWHYNAKSGRCDPSQTTIANRLRVPRRSVVRALAQLRDEGLLTWRRRHGGSCQYEPKWSQLEDAYADMFGLFKTGAKGDGGDAEWLRRYEAAVRSGYQFTADELERCEQRLSAIHEDGDHGDELGGWAYRLLQDLPEAA